MNVSKIKEAVSRSYTYREAYLKLGLCDSGASRTKLKTWIEEYNIDISHFDKGKKRRKYDIVNKKCPVCGEEFETQKGHIGEKETCSITCSNSYKPKRIKLLNNGKGRNREYVCINCGNTKNGSGKNFCNTTCYAEYMRKQKIQDWIDGKLLGHSKKSYHIKGFVRDWLMDRASNKCEKCGCDHINPYTHNSILQIHHIDGNANNTVPSNLQVLCPNCHAMTDNFLNMGGRRSTRYNYKKEYNENRM